MASTTPQGLYGWARGESREPPVRLTRLTFVKRLIAIALILPLSVAFVGCSAGGEGAGSHSPDTVGQEVERGSTTADLMATALRYLAESQGKLFTEYLIQSSLDPQAGSGRRGCCSRPLTDKERASIEAAVSELAPVRFIEDPADWRGDDLNPVVEGSAILGVGEPKIDGDGALVPVSLWCSGLCGTWLTYRLQLGPEGWTVTGPEGPIAIS